MAGVAAQSTPGFRPDPAMILNRGALGPAPIGLFGAQQTDPRTPSVVHIVDADRGARASLCELLAVAGIQTLEHSDTRDFLAARRAEAEGCLVLGAAGLSEHAHLERVGASLPVVLLAAQADVRLVVRAFKAGVVELLMRPIEGAQLLDAVRSAIAIHRQWRLVERQRAALHDRFETLTRREREVMALVTAGKMNKQVAWELGLSEITVKAHRGVVMRKMAARTLADLVRMADALAAAPQALERLQLDALVRIRH